MTGKNRNPRNPSNPKDDPAKPHQQSSSKDDPAQWNKAKSRRGSTCKDSPGPSSLYSPGRVPPRNEATPNKKGATYFSKTIRSNVDSREYQAIKDSDQSYRPTEEERAAEAKMFQRSSLTPRSPSNSSRSSASDAGTQFNRSGANEEAREAALKLGALARKNNLVSAFREDERRVEEIIAQEDEVAVEDEGLGIQVTSPSPAELPAVAPLANPLAPEPASPKFRKISAPNVSSHPVSFSPAMASTPGKENYLYEGKPSHTLLPSKELMGPGATLDGGGLSLNPNGGSPHSSAGKPAECSNCASLMKVNSLFVKEIRDVLVKGAEQSENARREVALLRSEVLELKTLVKHISDNMGCLEKIKNFDTEALNTILGTKVGTTVQAAVQKINLVAPPATKGLPTRAPVTPVTTIGGVAKAGSSQSSSDESNVAYWKKFYDSVAQSGSISRRLYDDFREDHEYFVGLPSLEVINQNIKMAKELLISCSKDPRGMAVIMVMGPYSHKCKGDITLTRMLREFLRKEVRPHLTGRLADWCKVTTDSLKEILSNRDN